MPPLYLPEWNKQPVDVHFSGQPEAQAWLDDLNKTGEQIQSALGLMDWPLRGELHRAGGQAHVRLWARHVNGWISIQGKELVILPKYLGDPPNPTAGRLFAHLLAYSGSSRFEFRSDVSADRNVRTPADILANKFLRELTPALEQGLAAAYSSSDSVAPVIKGKLAVGQLFPRVLWAPHELPQEISEYHHDIPANRLLRWACETLAVLVKDRRLHRELSELSGAFSGVKAEIPENSETHPIRVAPAHAHLQPALDLASMVARARFLSPASGVQVATGLVFVGWHVFQEYVGKLLRDAVRKAGLDLRIELQRSVAVGKRVGAGAHLFAHPDFQIQSGPRTLATGDAKYQRPMESGDVPDASSVAQVITAAHACGAEYAIIFRPLQLETAIVNAPREWRVLGSGRPQRVLLYFPRPASITNAEAHKSEVERLMELLKHLMTPRAV